GVFVKHVVPGSAADQSGNIRVHDRLLALDDISLHGMTNQEVLEVMKQTGQTVVLTLVRKKARGLERSLDKVERESSRGSQRRSLEMKTQTRVPLFSAEVVSTSDSVREISSDLLLPCSHRDCRSAAEQSSVLLMFQKLCVGLVLESCNCVCLCAASDEELRAKWEAALGPQYHVLVSPEIQPVFVLQMTLTLGGVLLCVFSVRCLTWILS
ncbi:hypothetical protein XENOCAPTIV_019608, partial [Xenoophorus captivus]